MGSPYWLSLAPSRLPFIKPSVAGTCDCVPVRCIHHVSALSPSTAPRDHAGGLRGQNCRYDGDYEKTMGVQAKAYQRMVVRMV